MTKYNYIRARNKAQELITRFGRQITLVRPTQIKQNPDRPWKGPDQTVPPQILVIPGIQLLPNQVRVFQLSALGEASMLEGAILVSELVYIVFQGETDIRDFSFVEDNGVKYHINATQALKPADITLLGYIGVRR